MLTFFLALDGRIARGEAVLLLLVFLGWLAWTLRSALLLLLPNRAGLIVRGRGFMFLTLYAGFVWATLLS